jgi:hypothetical protein
VDLFVLLEDAKVLILCRYAVVGVIVISMSILYAEKFENDGWRRRTNQSNESIRAFVWKFETIATFSKPTSNQGNIPLIKLT